MPVAIAAVDITFFINLKPDPGVPQCGGNISTAVASDTRFADSDCFGGVGVHERRLAKPQRGCNG
jgi:hypothetical protein